MAEKTFIELALEAKGRLRPKTGFRVVAVDDYEMEPGDALYKVGDFEGREEAEECAREHTEETGERAYVYEPRKRE